MSEEILLYIESKEGPVPAQMPLRFDFADGGSYQIRHVFLSLK